MEPGLSDVFARHAADELFSSIDEVGIRDGANLTVDGFAFCPTFSIWTTIEECLNPPVVWEKDRGWFTTAPFSEPETFNFPAGIGPVECVNVEHEEVLLIPRWIDAARVTFKYGLGDEFISVLKVLHLLGLDSTSEVAVGRSRVAPRDVVAACLPDPAEIGDRMHGVTCAGTWVTGTSKAGRPERSISTMRWTTTGAWPSTARRRWSGRPPSIRCSLSSSSRPGAGRASASSGPEALPPVPFLDLLGDSGAPWGMEERSPAP